MRKVFYVHAQEWVHTWNRNKGGCILMDACMIMEIYARAQEWVHIHKIEIWDHA
jgi:hypothetical protein